jgi:L-seryl-tRNA(Ser) seleniumtransferase
VRDAARVQRGLDGPELACRDRREQASARLRIVRQDRELRGDSIGHRERARDEAPVVGRPTGLDAGAGEVKGTLEGGQCRRIEDEAGIRYARHLEAVAEEAEPCHVRRGAKSVIDEDLGCGTVQDSHLHDGRIEVGICGSALAAARDEEAGPETLREDQGVARLGPALAQQSVRVGDADDREPVLRLRVANRVTAGKGAARLADLRRRAVEDRAEGLSRQVLGESGDREGKQDPAAHRVDVRQGVRRGDLAVRPRVVDERREEVERAEDSEVGRDDVCRGVVRWVEAGHELVRDRAAPDAEACERFLEHVGAELRCAATALRQLGQSQPWSEIQRRHRPIIRVVRSTIGPGAVLGRCLARSSKSVTLRSAWRGGFDSHALPPAKREEALTTTERARPPSVERVLAAARAATGDRDPQALLVVAREVVATERARLVAGDAPRDVAALGAAVVATLEASGRPAAVINATGVLIHTNLGRVPWPPAAIEAAVAASGTLLLELDPVTGRRGQRYRLAEDHLVALTGAEDALVTNNNAAAVALAACVAGRGRGVVVSRGELVEIGGGVRIPEIVRRAGGHLIEVGTTNRTRAEDFEAPLAEGGGKVVLRVHPSNFVQSGFTETPDARAVAAIAHRHGAIVVDDLGSGALLPTERYGLAHEPTPAERLALGSDLVTFSGDKLVGGPQAGLIVGKASLIARLRREPLARAIRPDKVTLAAVAATLGLYRAGLAETEIPLWRMIATPLSELARRAAAVAKRLGGAATVVELRSTVGGGSLPGETLASSGLALRARSVTGLLAALRTGSPPVIARIEDRRVLVDLRTVEPDADDGLAAAISRALEVAAARA